MKVTFTTLAGPELDRLAPLWMQLRDHHVEVSDHIRDRFAGVTLVQRREDLVRKGIGGLHADLARDGGTLIGYCVASVNGEYIGEIDSIYVEPACRRAGVGAGLMQRALAWLETLHVERTVLGIGEGNEAVTAFYRHFGFEVRTTIMERPAGQG